MRIDLGQKAVAVITAVGLLLLAGCAARPAAETGAIDSRDASQSRAAVGTPADSAELEPSAEAESVIAQILAERRRSDYPDIDLSESGFTITERMRVRSDARSDYERALSLFLQERYDEGIAILEGVVETTPELTSPYIDLAIAFRQVGDLQLAEEALVAAQLLSPNNPVVFNELGIVYRKTGRFNEARASYEQALDIFGEFHFARRNLAILCDLFLADLECALQNYQAYLDSVGDDPEVAIWIADLNNRLAN
jgi:Flp pilus assembly protein TadD